MTPFIFWLLFVSGLLVILVLWKAFGPEETELSQTQRQKKAQATSKLAGQHVYVDYNTIVSDIPFMFFVRLI